MCIRDSVQLVQGAPQPLPLRATPDLHLVPLGDLEQSVPEPARRQTVLGLQPRHLLAVQAANGTQSDTNRAALNSEVQQLLAQIDDIAWDTEFNGVRVLSSTGTITLQAGPQAGQTLVISLQGASTVQLGISAITVSSMSAAVSALSTIDLALRSVTSLRSTLGAMHNRLEFTIRTLAIQEENSAAAESVIRDADIARETINFTRYQILVAAGTAVLAQASVMPQTALRLLGI